jgi:hypothetical protein
MGEVKNYKRMQVSALDSNTTRRIDVSHYSRIISQVTNEWKQKKVQLILRVQWVRLKIVFVVKQPQGNEQ